MQREGPGVAAEVLDAAQSDLLVVVVALAGPGAQVAEPAASPDRDLLEGRVGLGGAVVHGAFDEVLEAFGWYWHACQSDRPAACGGITPSARAGSGGAG
ncbi:MAG: hypothetical protein ACQSGP_05765, partial [Frankia sp.]